MGHAHDHGVEADLRAAPELRRLMVGAVVVIMAATVVGLAVWWPGPADPLTADFVGVRREATVVAERLAPCAFGGSDDDVCVDVTYRIDSGPDKGSVVTENYFLGVTGPPVEIGDRVILNEFVDQGGRLVYSFADFQRARPLWILAGLFVVAVVGFGRFQGVRALLALGVTAVVLLRFVLPALVEGHPPLPVALVGASVIAVAALYLSHGVSDTTTVALLGTLAALGLTGALAAVFNAATHLTGRADEDAIFLLATADAALDTKGLILAGVVLGSLGVLDDVTVTQVSAVARLREANPTWGARHLYGAGIVIGRDHIASTVNTLVLAYAGASLPLLLYFSNVGIGLGHAATREDVAIEIIRTLVGSIGLIAAVPVTTALAAVVVTGRGLRRGRSRPVPPDPSGAPAAASTPAPPTEGVDVDVDAAPTSRGWDDFAPDPQDF